MSAPITVAYVFRRYPTLSQTFLQREVSALWKQGIRVEIHSLLPRKRSGLLPPRSRERADPPGGLPVDWFRRWEMMKLLVALPRELWRDPSLAREGLRLLRRYRFNNSENFLMNVWGAIFALCRAPEFRRHRPHVIHGAWATGPATAAAILGRLCDVPFSFGAQAYDIYRHGGDAFLEPKLRAARFVHTTTEANVEYLRQRAAGANIVLARRGLERLPELADKTREPGPVRILSVGRLVPMKGHVYQLEACALLKAGGESFDLRIVGDGPLRRDLLVKIETLGLANAVTLLGELQPELVESEYHRADIFWHTGIVDRHGDHDGLPNVIPEAFAHGLPVISTDAGGAAEAAAATIVPAGNARALADAVARLARDEPLRRQLGERGRRWVEENFLASKNAAVLAEAFREAAASEPPA